MSFGHHRRTHLFLVRIWAEDTGAKIASGEALDGEGEDLSKTEWRGKVQRAVDGEAHQFSSWQGLVDLLLAMLSSNKGG